MIYVYAIAEPSNRLPAVTGLDRAPLESIAAGALRGVYTSHVRVATDPDPESLWTHERVVEALMRESAVLPLRFGTVLRHADALRARLQRDATRFHRLLERVRGCVELAVRIQLPVPGREEPGSPGGAEYLRGKLAFLRSNEEAAERVLVPLAEAAAGIRRRERGGPSSCLAASYLVRSREVGRFAHDVRVLQERNPDLVLSCTGPWAPYSFVREEGAG